MALMAAISNSPVTFTNTTSSAASDLLRSSSNGVNGVPLKSLGRRSVGLGATAKRIELAVISKLRKGKKHEYPWPKDADENVKGGVLTHLSVFKPLKEKPKPVTLDFEKPLMDLQKKIIDVRKMANETGLDFSDQIILLENKYHQALKDLYTHLTPIQRVSIARHPNRPTFLDHIFNITDKWVELHGDRAGYDDPAIVCGLGSIGGRRYMFMGHQKGRNTKENIQRNFGMPTPHGYRKALRFMYYADHHNLPIVTFIDTPGAFADLKSEELGQGEAIAHNLRSMFGLKVPVVSIVIGEGGSGGALAIGCANKLLMLENAVFYVASPEACAAILWKTAKASPKAAEKLKITATELSRLKICDGIIPEPLGGAHADSAWTSEQIKIAITESMDELLEMDTPAILAHRHAKFRQLGGFQEGIPQDPIKKKNMKRRETPTKTSDVELEEEIEKLKANILEASKSVAAKPQELGVDEMIMKLRREMAMEYSIAVESMGLTDKLKALKEEFTKANFEKKSISGKLVVDPAMEKKIDILQKEFEQGLSKAPNYSSLKYRQDMLKEISKAKLISEESRKVLDLKKEINQRAAEVVKSKLEALKAELANGGISAVNAMKVKAEIQSELVDLFQSLNLNVERVAPKPRDLSEMTSSPELKLKSEELNKEIKKVMEYVTKSEDLKEKTDLLKSEFAKAGMDSSPELKTKIEALISQSIAEALTSSGLIDKYEKLKAEIIEAIDATGGPNGSVNELEFDEAELSTTQN